MKICYIANSGNSHTEKWANYFIEQGHEVHIISHSNTEIKGAKLHYLNYNLKNFLIMAPKVHKLIKQINPDVLHAHQANTCGFYAATMRGYKPVVSAWGSDILLAPQRSKLLKWITQYVLKKASFITSDAYFMSDKIIELGGAKEKVYTFPMGVEKEIFNFKHEYNKSEAILKLLSIRRLEKIYNIDIIIKGFNEALKVNQNLELTIAATGNDKEALEKLVLDLGIKNKVNFLGRYNPGEVGKILAANDVFVSVPSSDSTSVSLLEAMATGVYPVLSNLPANKEWVKTNGLILENTNIEEVKTAILWCAQNKEKMQVAAEGNIEVIRTRAVWADNAKIVEELYRKVNNN